MTIHATVTAPQGRVCRVSTVWRAVAGQPCGHVPPESLSCARPRPLSPRENMQGTLILRASLAFLEWLDPHVYSAGEAGGIRRRVLQPHHCAAPCAGNRNGGVANDNTFDVRVTTQQTPFDHARRHTRAGASRTPLVLALIATSERTPYGTEDADEPIASANGRLRWWSQAAPSRQARDRVRRCRPSAP